MEVSPQRPSHQIITNSLPGTRKCFVKRPEPGWLRMYRPFDYSTLTQYFQSSRVYQSRRPGFRRLCCWRQAGPRQLSLEVRTSHRRSSDLFFLYSQSICRHRELLAFKARLRRQRYVSGTLICFLFNHCGHQCFRRQARSASAARPDRERKG